MDNTLKHELQKVEVKHELLQAMLFIAQDNWEGAHNIAQKKEGLKDYDELHALLHRIEGDEWNAKYWYRRINKPLGRMSIEEEWHGLTLKFLKNYSH